MGAMNEYEYKCKLTLSILLIFSIIQFFLMSVFKDCSFGGTGDLEETYSFLMAFMIFITFAVGVSSAACLILLIVKRDTYIKFIFFIISVVFLINILCIAFIKIKYGILNELPFGIEWGNTLFNRLILVLRFQSVFIFVMSLIGIFFVKRNEN